MRSHPYRAVCREARVRVARVVATCAQSGIAARRLSRGPDSVELVLGGLVICLRDKQ